MQHLRRLIIFLFTLTATVGALAALNLALSIGQPFGGFFAGYLHAASLWQVEAATPPWWPVIARDILRYDDALVAVEGEPYSPEVYTTYSNVYNSGRHFVKLTVLRDGKLRTFDVPLYIFTSGNYLDIKLPDLINGLGFWLLGAAVFRARAQNPVNHIFALASCFASGAIWLTIQGLFTEAPGATRLLQLVWVGVATYVGTSFIHLTLLFPDPMRRPFVRYIPILYVVMTVVALLYIVSFVIRWQFGPILPAVVLAKYCNIAAIGSTGIGVGVYLARLLYLLTRRNISRRLRRQSIFLLWGVLLAVPYVLVIVLRSIVQSPQAYFIFWLDIRYLALAVPVSFAFVILRYQTLQRIHRAVSAVFILAASAMLASVATWIMRLAEPTWANTLNWSPFVPLFLVSLITATFYSLQNSLRGALGKVFQWEFRSYTAVRKFTQQVLEQTDPAALPTTITRALVDKLELECASVWLWEESANEYRLAGSAGAWRVAPPERLPLEDPSRRPLQPMILGADPETGPIPGWLEPVRQTGKVEVVAPLVVSGEPIGILGLGKRWDEEIFDNRDLEIIELVALQAALFILTAEQIQQLRQVPYQITSAQERERFKIAQELHDTVQQFLGRLPFYLQVSRDKARADPAETESILQRCIGDVESAAQAVRQIRNNLAPFQLDSSLIQPINTLIDNFRARTGIETRTDFMPDTESPLSLEARHALYRVVQQALDNIAAHANAAHVTIAVQPENGHLRFAIVDDGRGSTDAERREAATRGSFGLTSMRARVTGLGGELHFESQPDSGTTVSGWLPLS